MILVDHQIKKLCKRKVPFLIRVYHLLFFGKFIGKIKPLVEPFNSYLVNPASIDVRIGDSAKLRVLNGYKEIDLSQYNSYNPYLIHPGERILVATLETFNLPNFICAQFRLKSSRGREWYEHMEAGFCDPGWHGSKLTMEIVNLDLMPLPLYPGLPMGQLVFSLTLSQPDRDYSITGRYNGDRQVSGSKG